MKTLHLGKGLELPADDALESAIGIIAKRGRGKSGAIKVLMEELTRVGLPFVAFDPVGILWGIRSSFDGTAPGLPVLVIGGEHGDVPLDRKAGAAVAQRIVKENVSCVIDFSEEPKAAYREFVRDFAHELFRKNDTPRMVILEEAPELVPQKVMHDRADVFEAVERLVSRGRNKGLGVVIVSQRAATINKDVLTQVDALLIMGLAAPQDRKALGDWIRAWDVELQAAEFDLGLASLKRQEAWFWSPEAFGGIFAKVRIRDFTTFHPDKTHLRRMGWLKVRPVTADVAGVVSRFKGEKPKKEEDVDEKERKEYEDRIRSLESENSVVHRKIRELEQQLKTEHDRAEANAKAAAANAVDRIKVAPTPHQLRRALDDAGSLPPGDSEPPAERERIDLTVEREVPNLTVKTRVVSVKQDEGDMVGRIAILIAEGFWDDGPKRQADAGHEFVRRGYGMTFSSGGNSVRLSEAFAKMTLWGFFRKEGGAYTLVPEARKRVRVAKEEVAA